MRVRDLSSICIVVGCFALALASPLLPRREGGPEQEGGLEQQKTSTRLTELVINQGVKIWPSLIKNMSDEVSVSHDVLSRGVPSAPALSPSLQKSMAKKQLDLSQKAFKTVPVRGGKGSLKEIKKAYGGGKCRGAGSEGGCSGHGVCASGTCQCGGGWYGPHCERICDEGTNPVCRDRGICKCGPPAFGVGPNICRCDCFGSYEGDTCLKFRADVQSDGSW